MRARSSTRARRGRTRGTAGRTSARKGRERVREGRTRARKERRSRGPTPCRTGSASSTTRGRSRTRTGCGGGWATRGSPQGCSVLLRQAIGEEAIEAEGVGVEGLTHVADAVGAQDVERKGA